MARSCRTHRDSIQSSSRSWALRPVAVPWCALRKSRESAAHCPPKGAIEVLLRIPRRMPPGSRIAWSRIAKSNWHSTRALDHLWLRTQTPFDAWQDWKRPYSLSSSVSSATIMPGSRLSGPSQRVNRRSLGLGCPIVIHAGIHLRVVEETAMRKPPVRSLAASESSRWDLSTRFFEEAISKPWKNRTAPKQGILS